MMATSINASYNNSATFYKEETVPILWFHFHSSEFFVVLLQFHSKRKKLGIQCRMIAIKYFWFWLNSPDIYQCFTLFMTSIYSSNRPIDLVLRGWPRKFLLQKFFDEIFISMKNWKLHDIMRNWFIFGCFVHRESEIFGMNFKRYNLSYQ